MCLAPPLFLREGATPVYIRPAHGKLREPLAKRSAMSQQDQRFSALYEVKDDDLVQLLQALEPIKAQWYEFGFNLKLQMSDLDLIKANTEIENRLLQLLKQLLRRHRLTWPDIVEALLKINRNDIARIVKEDYCPSYVSSLEAHGPVSLGLVWVLRSYAVTAQC